MNIEENPELKKVVKVEEGNKLKEYLVNYVGTKLQPKNNEVTVEMIVQEVANDFPEFLMVVAEENWIRGYRQAFLDMEASEQEKTKKEDELVIEDESITHA